MERFHQNTLDSIGIGKSEIHRWYKTASFRNLRTVVEFLRPTLDQNVIERLSENIRNLVRKGRKDRRFSV